MPKSPIRSFYESTFCLGGEVTTYEVKAGFITKRFANTDNPYSDQSRALLRRKPSATEWAGFWAEVAPLRLWEWKPSYSTSELTPRVFISDGGFWQLSCHQGWRRMRASGCNGAPKFSQPQEATLDGETFSRLDRALERLLRPLHLQIDT